MDIRMTKVGALSILCFTISGLTYAGWTASEKIKSKNIELEPLINSRIDRKHKNKYNPESSLDAKMADDFICWFLQRAFDTRYADDTSFGIGPEYWMTEECADKFYNEFGEFKTMRTTLKFSLVSTKKLSNKSASVQIEITTFNHETNRKYITSPAEFIVFKSATGLRISNYKIDKNLSAVLLKSI